MADMDITKVNTNLLGNIERGFGQRKDILTGRGWDENEVGKMKALMICRDVKQIAPLLRDMNPFRMVAEVDRPEAILATFVKGTPTLATLCCFIHHLPNVDSTTADRLLTLSLQEYERGQVHPKFDDVFKDAGDHRAKFSSFCASYGPPASQRVSQGVLFPSRRCLPRHHTWNQCGAAPSPHPPHQSSVPPPPPPPPPFHASAMPSSSPLAAGPNGPKNTATVATTAAAAARFPAAPDAALGAAAGRSFARGSARAPLPHAATTPSAAAAVAPNPTAAAATNPVHTTSTEGPPAIPVSAGPAAAPSESIPTAVTAAAATAGAATIQQKIVEKEEELRMQPKRKREDV
ncbi:unnamed protein product, partial [Ectocarpus sp. 8 AP-2014]